MALFGLLLLAAIAALVSNRSKNAPFPEEARLLATEGVAENASWQPVIRAVSGLDMALVPAGCFVMGATDEQLVEAQDSCDAYYGAFGCSRDFSDEQPAHEVCISAPYWIGLTAVTNRQYGSNSGPGSGSMRRQPNWPRETVTWAQADEFCRARGLRLPREAEWEFAARGPDALIYPWGNVYDIELATLRKISPAPVGERPAGASWVGALDMAGGIAEWVTDWYGPYPAGSVTDPTGPLSGELRVARGGDWFAHAAFLVRTTFRQPLAPAYATTSVGFRCAGDFAPSTP